MTQHAIRKHGYVAFSEQGREESGWLIARGRGKTFLVEWCEATQAGAELTQNLKDEAIVVFAKSGGRLTIGGATQTIDGRSIAIVPPGAVSIVAGEIGGLVIVLTPLRAGDLDGPILNAGDYPDRSHEGMQTVAPPSGTVRPLQIIAVDQIVAPKDKPRLKIVRSETLSISWIEYDGVRDRTQLSPHDHADFEQGSLAIEGGFIHHLRVPWGPDATQWRDDEHVAAAAKSLCVIPPRVIHTTEGAGGGKHILLDIFAPVREDFAGKGWIFNNSRYASA